MNKKPIFSLLIFIVLILFSCNSNDVNNSLDNYWERSDLAKMNLKGKVKTITNGGIVTSYNEAGFIISIVNNSGGNSNTSIYSYNANRQLIQTVTTSLYEGSQYISTTTNEYNNQGKYVVKSTASLELNGLTPNLSSSSTVSTYYNDTHIKIDYVFKDASTMFIINTTSINSINLKDTSTIQYNGNYPTGWSTEDNTHKNITYFSNGMFKTITKESVGTNVRYSSVYAFKTNNDYLMTESIVQTRIDSITPSNNYTYTDTYTYNDNNDITDSSENGNISHYSNYTYDSHGNYVTRILNYKYRGTTNFIIGDQESRIITYW